MITNFDRPLEKFSNLATIDDMIKIASKIMGCDITKNTREQKHVKGRQFVMHHLLTERKYSLANAGGVFGLDHSTAFHAKKVVNDLIETKDKEYYQLWLKFKNLSP